MRQRRRGVGLVAASAVMLLTAAACGSSSGGGSSSGNGSTNTKAGGDTIIWGTTDTPVSFDPAGSYDLPSWNVVYNVYQTLVRIDPTTLKTVPDAAQSCQPSTDFTTWTCTLKSGQKFSNGDPVTAKDVKFSLDRVISIKSPAGPASLLSDVTSVDAQGDNTVVIHLKSGNALLDYILATGAGAIVDSKVFPADKVLDSSKVIGSGPYALKTYESGQVAQFVPNKDYGGDLKLNNKGMVIQYYKDANTLKLDVQSGKVDVAYRNLTPTQLQDLQGKSNLDVVSGPGGEIRYLTFNLNTMPGSSDAQKLAIRQAAAYVIDRDSIAKNVYKGTVDPLYSMVPAGLSGHEDVYKTRYGATPSKEKAAQVLQQAGVKTPVNITVFWTPSHYGPLSGDEYTEIKRQLDGSGLFKVDLQSTEWEQYTANCLADKCPAYQLGWFPDYPDTDDYVGVFYKKDSFLHNHYSDPAVEQLIKQEESLPTSKSAQREPIFKQIQEKTVDATPVIPIWQGKQIAVAAKDITGLKDTLLPDYIFRFWVLGKS